MEKKKNFWCKIGWHNYKLKTFDLLPYVIIKEYKCLDCGKKKTEFID